LPYPPEPLTDQIAACQLCAPRFAATPTGHSPRPVVWFRPSARVLIAGQAPGMRVHLAGRPFQDASGDRLRAWTGLNEAIFYDRDRIAIVPMAFCFPGYDAKGGDLPPPSLCARTWHAQVMAALPDLRLILLVGGAAQRWHLGRAGAAPATVQDCVAGWRMTPQIGAARVFPLPHPSWRNTGWLKRNPWFEADLLPDLRAAVGKVMQDD
jgi:uracil-DNA glycosylase